MNGRNGDTKKNQGWHYLVTALVLGMTVQSGVEVQAQELWWAKGINASIADIVADGVGNSYVTGSLGRIHPVIFGAGEANETTLTAVGPGDFFVAKYATNGSLVWAKLTNGEAFAVSIAVDGSGHSYVTGRLTFGSSNESTATTSTTVFGLGEPHETTLVSERSTTYIFVAKYAPNGDLVWAKRAGRATAMRVGGIAVDGSGHSYVTGQFDGDFSPAVFGPGEPNETALTSSGQSDMFVAKYAPNGDLVWAKRAGGGSRSESGLGIAVDAAGTSFVTGQFSGGMIFGLGESNETALTSADGGQSTFGAPSLDIFVAKYAPNGDLVWAKQAGGSESDYGEGIAVDKTGHSYVTGAFGDHSLERVQSATFGLGELNETILVSHGDADIFVAKYAPNGALVWAKGAGGGSGEDKGLGIAVDGAGHTYVTGVFLDPTFGSSVIFGAGEPNQTTLTIIRNGGRAIFAAEYAANGNLVWAKRVGSGAGLKDFSAIAVDGAGHHYVTGDISGPEIFGSGELNETALNGSSFLAKFNASNAAPPPLSCSLDAFEPDDSSGQASSLIPGTNQSHSICPRRNGDWATFTLSQESGVEVETSGPTGKDTVLRIRNSGLSPIAFDDNGGTGNYSNISRTCGTNALPAGQYYVEVNVQAVSQTASQTIDQYTLALTTSACSGEGSRPGLADVNGDGQADLVWRNTTNGGTMVWQMTAAGLRGPIIFPGGVATNWEIQDVADVNGDGRADLVWRNMTNGATHVWQMTASGTRGPVTFPGGLPLHWVLQAVADVNGDGRADFIWRNTNNGATHVWQMTASGTRGPVTFPGGLPLHWVIQDVADVNGDGRADFIWRNTNNGATHVWQMTASGIRGPVTFPGGLPVHWVIQAVADVNGDGRADFVWRNTNNGATHVWQMTASGIRGPVTFPGGLPTNWVIQAVADVNGDGRADVVWRNTNNGATHVWQMTAGALRGPVTFPGGLPLNWELQP